MGLPEKEWYSIHELAGRWGIPTKDVLHYLDTKKLSAYLLLEPHEYSLIAKAKGTPNPCENRKAFLHLEDIQNLTWSRESSTPGEQDGRFRCIIEKGADLLGEIGYCRTSRIVERDVTSVFIISKEVLNIENPTVASSYPAVPYLDPTHPYFCVKLSAAIAAWTAICDNGQPILKRSPKSLIVDWLELHRKEYGLTNQAIEEIAKVVNPQPNGGTPPTSKEGKPKT